ncbi:hypothetical protein GF380_06660 [Candidatus Uhrbacteria bacterium]|nr:hypothetical protein [Candidatus Uhrbacteria bacterium]
MANSFTALRNPTRIPVLEDGPEQTVYLVATSRFGNLYAVYFEGSRPSQGRSDFRIDMEPIYLDDLDMYLRIIEDAQEMTRRIKPGFKPDGRVDTSAFIHD